MFSVVSLFVPKSIPRPVKYLRPGLVHKQHLLRSYATTLHIVPSLFSQLGSLWLQNFFVIDSPSTSFQLGLPCRLHPGPITSSNHKSSSRVLPAFISPLPGPQAPLCRVCFLSTLPSKTRITFLSTRVILELNFTLDNFISRVLLLPARL